MTIRDVAAEAGVSVTTVSHALNETPRTRTSEETRQRVREAARRLGYGPNRLAQGLRTQRTRLIGLLSEDIATTPHSGQIIRGAQDAARAAGYTLVIVDSRRLGDRSEREHDISALLQEQVDGVLLATMFHREITVPDALTHTPLVLVDAEDRRGRVPAFVPDEYAGATAAVRALTDAGHRRIGFITNTEDVPATRLRLAAYRDTLAAASQPFDPDLVLSDESEVPGGYRTALDLLRHEPRATALFCYNDRMAMGAYRAAAELGLTIPDDLSIVGFDNQELIAANLHPPLSTVALPHYEMGALAVTTLLRLLDHAATDTAAPTLLPCPFVARDSISAMNALHGSTGP